MSYIKNNPKFTLYYSDTDSAVIDKPLDPDLVGPGLGKFKLEHEIIRGVFLAPKVYGLITKNEETILKVKGLTKDAMTSLNFQKLENLLYKQNKEIFNQRKWIKSLYDSTITVVDVAYQLTATSNKRAPVFESGTFTSTRPYVYGQIEEKTAQLSTKIEYINE